MLIFDFVSGARVPAVFAKALTVSLLALTVAGCEHMEEKPSHSAGWSLLDASQRHPILVSQQPHNMTVRVPRGQHGLAPSQRAQIYSFLTKYKSQDSGNSKIVISVPAGSANELAAMSAVADMRPLLSEQGFSDPMISIEPYQAEGDPQPPIRVSYLRYNAQGPECGRWPENLAESKRNLNYQDFGCSQQKNLAAQIANPADLLGPRTMPAGNADRRDTVYEKYIKGDVTHSNRSADERAVKN